MAVVEDAASVLEQFVQDVANLPAEIAHLLEEVEAKDKVIQECRNVIHTRDSSIQKHLKVNGAGHAHPKDDAYTKSILSNFDKAMGIQDEKVALSEKASVILDRQVKRLDIQIRALQTEGVIPPDPLIPSLLHSTPGNRLPPLSIPTTGTTTPLHPIHSNIAAAPPSTTIAHSSLARLVQPTQQHRHPSPLSTGPQPPTPSIQVHPIRDSSLDSKRRRLNLPAASSSLRQSSLGPGTPKAGTPAAVSRAGSAGPRATANKKPTKGGSLTAPHQRLAHLNPLKKGSSRRKGRKGMKPSPSEGEDSAVSEVGGSESEAGHRGGGGEGHEMDIAGLEEEEEEGEGDGESDNRKYCTCRSVSYGNMVACDNQDCAYEWFHWSCVGITKEPPGKWYCEECRVKLGMKG